MRFFGDQFIFQIILTTTTFIGIISHSSTYIFQVIHKMLVFFVTRNVVLSLCLHRSLWASRRVANYLYTRICTPAQCFHAESGDVSHIIEPNNTKTHILMTSVHKPVCRGCPMKTDGTEYSWGCPIWHTIVARDLKLI